MALPPAAATFQAEQAAHARQAQRAALVAWAKIPPKGDWLGAWLKLLPGVVARAALLQASIAGRADASLVRTLDAQGLQVDPAGVQRAAFAGWLQSPTVDGLAVPLSEALATAPIIRARQAGSLAAGADMVSLTVQQAVAGAGREAMQAAITATPKASGAFYEPGKCCQRCAVLVGKKMPYGSDFERHPRCDGTVVAVPSSGRVPFAGKSVEDVKDLTRDQLRAIEDGTDLNQVINAKTGVTDRREGGRSALTEGGSSTYQTPWRRGPKTRLTPKGIYAQAGDDRDKAIELLRANGYIS